MNFLDVARRILPPHPVICDVGSRDARESIALSNALEAQSLHVFEPNPEAAALCRQNLAELNAIAVHFNELAVADQVGERTFYPVNAGDSMNKDIGFSSLFRVNPSYTRRRGSIVQDEIVVRTTTLDAYFEGKQGPDLLWVDVEGAELEVFRGATNVLRDVRLIHVEVSFRPMQVGKPLFWEIREYLKQLGFLFYRFTEISKFKGFLYRYRLLPNLPWRLDAVFVHRRFS